MSDDPYSRVAGEYDDRWHRAVDQAEDKVMYEGIRPSVDGSDVLDLGCGTAHLLDFLKPAFYVGIDSSPGMLREAERKHGDRPGTHFLLGEVCELGRVAPLNGGYRFKVRPESFDIAVSYFAFSYFADPQAALLEARRALRPGGWMIAHAYTPRYVRRPSYVFGNGEGPEIREFWPDQLAREMQVAGFEQVLALGFRHLPDRLVQLAPANMLPALMKRAMRVLPKSWAYTTLAYGRRPL